MAIVPVSRNAVNATGVNSKANPYTISSNGNLIVIAAGVWHSGSAPASLVLTDTRGNTIPSPTVNITAATSRLAIWLIPNCIGGGVGSSNFTVTPNTTSDDINVDVYEYSGADLTAALDGTPVTAVDGGNTAQSIAVNGLVTTGTGSLILSCLFNQTAGVVVTHTLGGTQRLNNQNPDGTTSDQMELIANAGTYNDSMSWTGGSAVEAAIFAVKAGASGPTLLVPDYAGLIARVQRNK